MSEDNLEVNKSKRTLKEEEILKFWQDNKIFEESLAKDSPQGEFVFYDGPPFATGLPHYGHILASTIKDVIPRYKTMQGYYVRRRWGWDCHGLPIENIAEKDLKISGKKQIEEIGVKQFNEHARSKVLEFIHDWEKTVNRIGRWVDFDGSYKTMENSFMESVWWAIRQVHDQGLLYEGTRVLPYCPRCETPIANSEIAMDNSYRDIKDWSVVMEFELVDEPKTYVLAWTTTPWTLPGNTALAVNPDIDYVEVTGEVPENKYILAKSRVGSIFKDKFNILREFKGKELAGKKYKPLFDYYINDSNLKNRENGWQIYPADFVSTADGTGLVHIAPAFGEDDMNLAKKVNLPIIWHVDGTGRFKPEVKDFAGQLVKPKFDPDTAETDGNFGPIDYHQKTDVEIIKYLAAKDLLFAKEKITHSYPHCFRCETPLYYYAIPAWFIDIQKIKNDLLKLNLEKINWVPEHLKTGRFNNIIESAPDWNISRNRYWATPLPIWRCNKCAETKIVGSLDELFSLRKKSGNRYWAMRHGEAGSNVDDSMSLDPAGSNHLTDKGRNEVKETAQKLKEAKIDLIVASDFIRTKETAEIIAQELGLKAEQIIFDERLREIDPGQFIGKSWRDYNNAFGSRINRLHTHLPTGGENYNDVRRRTMSVIYEIDKKYEGKNFLIISHGLSLYMLLATTEFFVDQDIAKAPKRGTDFSTGEVRPINFSPVPHNDNFELDLHRPYVDDFELPCSCGHQLKRIVEVVDCWLESGSMPFAANHYPFDHQDVFNPPEHKGFPAQFVAEYIAQTRTWFYYMLVMSKIIFGDVPFEHVVTTGTVLAEDGQKMSKSKGNFPDPWLVFDKYGVDALRLYLLSSPVMRSEDLNFSGKGVAEVQHKIIMRLSNVAAFYETYVAKENNVPIELGEITNILDKWILVRLNEVMTQTGEALDRYEIDRALRPVDNFIDDLSTWYLRRSRERFKSDDVTDRRNAQIVTKFVLRTIAKILAPFAPFIAEEIWQKMRAEDESTSVHLTNWPKTEERLAFGDTTIVSEMAEARRIVSLGLELRAAAGLKVRQPLAEIKLKSTVLAEKAGYFELIKDELNVKDITFDANLGEEVWLDTAISEELKQEGLVREFTRNIQELRKTKGLRPIETITLTIETAEPGRNLLRKFETEIKKAANLKNINYAIVSVGEEIKTDSLIFKVSLS